MAGLKGFWKKWLGLSRAAGNVLGHILLTIFYFTVMLPFSLGVTLFSDPLKIKTRHNPFWQPRETPIDGLEEARRQF
jgi:hypothetical protein